MKGLVTFAILLGVVGAVIWLGVVKTSMSDQGEMFLIVLGEANDKGAMEFDVCVEMGTAMRAKPRLNERFEPQWDEWVDERFEMRDSTGTRLPSKRIAHTLLIDERKVKHLPEFYVQYQLESGKDYTLDFVPKNSDTRYRYAFKAAGPIAPSRETFTAVKNKS